MGFLDRLLGDDRARAAKYDGPSASEQARSAARVRRSRSADRADRAGQRWEAQDRRRFGG